MSRLGVVGATVLGAGVAFELGGYNGVLAAWLYGLPFSLPLAWHDAFSPALHGSPTTAWGDIHLVLGAATVASWTAVGMAVDYVRHRMGRPRSGTGPDVLVHREDHYLAAARLEVERMFGDRVPDTPSDDVGRPKRLLCSIGRLPEMIGVLVHAVPKTRTV